MTNRTSKELRRNDQSSRGDLLGGGAGVSQVTVRIAQRAMHDDEESLDIPVRHVEGARRMAQQQARLGMISHFDVLVAKRCRRLVLLVVPNGEGMVWLWPCSRHVLDNKAAFLERPVLRARSRLALPSIRC